MSQCGTFVVVPLSTPHATVACKCLFVTFFSVLSRSDPAPTVDVPVYQKKKHCSCIDVVPSVPDRLAVSTSSSAVSAARTMCMLHAPAWDLTTSDQSRHPVTPSNESGLPRTRASMMKFSWSRGLVGRGYLLTHSSPPRSPLRPAAAASPELTVPALAGTVRRAALRFCAARLTGPPSAARMTSLVECHQWVILLYSLLRSVGVLWPAADRGEPSNAGSDSLRYHACLLCCH